jgi:IclR family transcriptional regulator, acetate operon repressor
VGDTAPRGTLGTVHNAALLLTLLSDGPAHQALTDLADRSGMSLPTLHRLLRSLVLAGLVEQDPATSRYGLGPELVRLAEQYLGRLPVLKVAGPYLVDLRTATGATVTLTTLAGTDAVVADRLDGEDVGGVHRDATRVRPALDSAAGRILLAHADDPTWQAARAASRDGGPGEVERRTWRDAPTLTYVPPSPAGRPELAAPVRDDRRVVAALSLSLPGSPGDGLDDRHGAQLLRAASSISRVLGHG